MTEAHITINLSKKYFNISSDEIGMIKWYIAEYFKDLG